MTFDDCIAENNGWQGFVFNRDTDYMIGMILAIGNNENHEDGGNLHVESNARVEAEEIRSCDTVNGPGLDCETSESARVNTYVHSGNSGGAYGERDNLTVAEDVSAECESIASIPSADEVGAGTGC